MPVKITASEKAAMHFFTVWRSRLDLHNQYSWVYLIHSLETLSFLYSLSLFGYYYYLRINAYLPKGDQE